MIVIGIDPGLSGALCVLDSPYGADVDLFTVVDLPVDEVKVGAKIKRKLSAQLLRDMVESVTKGDYARIFIEQVAAMPGQGVTSMFGFGRTFGVIEGVCAGLLLPVSYVQPKAWQKHCAVRGGKDGSRARACEIFPQHAHLFSRVKDDGRADAALIAYYGATSK